VIIDPKIPVLLGALCCLAPMQSMKAGDGCPDLDGKDIAAHLEYLRGDRAKLSSKCVVASIKYVGDEHYAQASAALIQYLDYPDPAAVARRGHLLEVYPAIVALHGLRKSVVPELTAAIADAKTAELGRENAAFTILLICGVDQPEAIAILVRAAHTQTDPTAAIRLMDKARWLAGRCIDANRNECENAVLK
jgi:hypothetical protein